VVLPDLTCFENAFPSKRVACEEKRIGETYLETCQVFSVHWNKSEIFLVLVADERKPMKLINTLTALTWIVILLVACGGTGGDPLNGTDWELYSIGQYSPVPGSRVTVNFEDGQVSGNGGCNSYSGEYQVHGNKIEFGMLASTLMACVDPAMMEQETIFMGALGDARSFEIVDGQLQISGTDGEVLIFVPMQ
jgi:heat shock protein HslJ